ncbi:glycosyltransferase family 2 protein [Leclercia adecarboxylata]|uniref:glycosyltransferase family 2 protein n=1 Tax=Leclercia adecarboxylata TaxID=83655 RepID=UPI0025AED386|nr:glycosyltransferase family 2 protein [Leclercia adecarboxylata]WJT03720.1 glycosyltransferase family 2 protein [Leclercia adecarboxylata]
MHSDYHWHPLALPDTSLTRASWFLIQGTLRARQPRGETRLRWQCSDGTWHEQVLPITRRGTLQELVWLPVGACQVGLLASSEGAECELNITRFAQVSAGKSLWRRLRRVWPFYQRLNAQKRKRLGLSWHLWFTDLQQAYTLVGKIRDDRPLHAYEHWLANFDIVQPGERRLIDRLLARWGNLPHVCLHLVNGGDEASRQRTLASIASLCYPATRITVLEHPSVTVRPEGEWQWAIPVGAELAPAALVWLAHQLRQTPEAKWIYGDHDLLDEKGKRHSPDFKPDWNETLLHSQNYIGWSGLWREQGTFAIPQDGDENYRGWLQLARQLAPKDIAHIPALLMHVPDALVPHDGYETLANQLQDLPVGVTLESAPHGICRWRWPLPEQLPRVSVIIATRNGLAHLRPCIESLVQHTRYPNIEIMVMDNQSDDPDTLAYFGYITQEYGVRVIAWDHPFNYSAINNAGVREATGELICLLNNDTEVINPQWLDEMVSHLLRPGVGIVGARLFYGDGRVQHAGDAVGPGGCADHFHSGLAADEPGYQRRAVSAQELSAVTAACLLTHRQLFLSLNGLDEVNLPVAFNDVDYCLRVGEAGWRIVWTPFAELYHHESVSRGKDVTPEQLARSQGELRYMKKRWAQRLTHDPAYNPNLSYDRPDFSLSHAPNVVLPWTN